MKPATFSTTGRRRLERLSLLLPAFVALLVSSVRGPEASSVGVLAEQPTRGMFLVAGRELGDPNFARTVVLLLEYSRDGAVGVVVNRPTQTRLNEILPDVEGIDARPDVVFEGGPVPQHHLLMLFRSSSEPEDSKRVFDDVYATPSQTMLERMIRGGEAFRVYAGYAGWGPGQLDWEIQRGGWSLMAADAETVFDDIPDEVWRKTLRRADSPVA